MRKMKLKNDTGEKYYEDISRLKKQHAGNKGKQNKER